MSSKRSALIVATSDYKDSRLAHLEGPARDAEALRGVLGNKDIGGFDVRVALNSRVDTLRRTLETFFADRGRDDLLLVHFSGHGLKDDDGQLFLAAADTQIDRLLSTGVDAAWVNRLVTRCRSEKIALFLDCCFAGAFSTTMGRRVGVDTAGVNEQFTGSGRFVITASDAMQYAFESGRQVGDLPEPSPFTRALVDGLRTGEADRNEDGVVSIDELFDYLEDRIRETSPSQTPTMSAMNQVGDWVIAQSTRAPTVRLLPEDLQKQLKSDDAFDRFATMIDLRDLVEGADRRRADAARQALERLAGDDSRKVAAAARRLLDEEAVRPRSGARIGRRRPLESVLDRDETPVEAEAGGPGVAEARAATTPIEPEVAPVPAQPETAPVAFEAVDVADASAPVVADVAVVADAPVVADVPVVADAPALAEVGRAELAAPPAPPPPMASAPSAVPVPVPQVMAPFTASPPEPAVMAPLRDDTTGEGSWSLGSAIGRAAIGSFLWVLIQFGYFLGTSPYIANGDVNPDDVATVFGGFAFGMAIIAGAVVGVVEKFLPEARLPGGAIYEFVGHNRWGASALLGAVTGSTIGLAIELTYIWGRWGDMRGLGPEIPFVAAIGFVIAEFAVGRSSSPERGEPARSA